MLYSARPFILLYHSNSYLTKGRLRLKICLKSKNQPTNQKNPTKNQPTLADRQGTSHEFKKKTLLLPPQTRGNRPPPPPCRRPIFWVLLDLGPATGNCPEWSEIVFFCVKQSWTATLLAFLLSSSPRIKGLSSLCPRAAGCWYHVAPGIVKAYDTHSVKGFQAC